MTLELTIHSLIYSLFFYSECSLNLWSIRFILSKDNFCEQFKLGV